LRTERLELRPLEAGDAALLALLYDDAERELAKAVEAREAGLGWWVALEAGEPVAVVEVGPAGPGLTGIAADEAEIGWFVDERARGRGIATEAAAAVARHALDELAVPWLVAYVRPANTASLRVAAKLGMRDEGRGRTRGGDPCVVLRLRSSPR
jgi:RimJ/RimL family protein N-acetyltransferase